MKATRLDARFFDSTRGRIVTLLRGSARTVNDLAEKLGLTDNAVRAQLLSLERDGIVRQGAAQRGHRKPSFVYELTPDAERLFPKAYDALLNQLIAVLKDRLSAEELEGILRAVGRSLGAPHATSGGVSNLEQSTRRVLKALEALGGSARIEQEEGRVLITSRSCPFGAAVTEHPEVCRLAETLVQEIAGVPVREDCDRTETPRCRFELQKPK
ncbi:MAG TPA: ArsR family transcriptional regulator [Blastocatellia bacterium]|nr:ArsR family transcriptional regulator [Blastocatellia bacterium]